MGRWTKGPRRPSTGGGWTSSGTARTTGCDEVAATLVTADFVGHWPKHPGLARGPAQLADIVRQGRRLVDDCVFELVLGPVPHDDLVAARWRGRGRHQGDPVTFHGHDLLRVDGDRFAEYWVIAEDPTD